MVNVPIFLSFSLFAFIPDFSDIQPKYENTPADPLKRESFRLFCLNHFLFIEILQRFIQINHTMESLAYC